MASHEKRKPRPEKLELGGGFRRAQSIALFVGGGGLLAAILIGFFSDPSFRRFYFAYLVSFAFFLSLSLGAIFFVLIQHLTRAGWSVSVRRIAETIAAGLPVLAALSAPIVVSVIINRGDLYRWAQPVPDSVAHETDPAHGASDAERATGHETHPAPAKVSEADAGHEAEPGKAEAQGHGAGVPPLNELTLKKRAYLNPPFFVLRVAVYFAVWSLIAMWYWRKSVEQDHSGDASLTSRMQALAAPATVAFGITLTLGAFDLLMSLDPAWFSTIYGVYYFSGCAVGIYAMLIIVVYLLQRNGYLTESITREHYHDLGKFLFGFTFFWGYIAFSQYMLLWYANIPETTEWFARRGATTVREDVNGWTIISIALLFGHLLIPFAGLLSRHVKRRKQTLVIWAVWLLVFHWLDMLWLVMPELDPHGATFHLGAIEVLCLLGIGGIYVAALLRLALRHSLRPVADPRLEESLAFQNI